MNKTSRRVLSLALALVLMLSLATAASAAVVSWSDNEGGKTLSLTITEVSYVTKAVNNPVRYWHSKGTQTIISNYGAFSATLNANRSATLYPSHLLQAYAIDGIKNTYTVSGAFTSSLSVPADDPAGYYTLAVLFDTKSGNWSVSSPMTLTPNSVAVNAISAPVETGTLYYAPRGSVYGYTVIPVP